MFSSLNSSSTCGKVLVWLQLLPDTTEAPPNSHTDRAAGILTVDAFTLGMVLSMTEHAVPRHDACVPALARIAAMIGGQLLG